MRLRSQPANTPDPKALLQGVAARREQIPPSRLHIREVWESPLWRNIEEHVVLFKGELRYYVRTNANEVRRILWDGKDVLRFDGSQVNLRNLDTQTADYLFDPRLLGITTSFAWSARIADLLHPGASRIELVGREQIDGKAAWHVRIEDNDCEINIWIDEKKSFSVYRFDERLRDHGFRTTRAFYDNQDYSWLPSRIDGQEFDAKSQLICKRQISILDASAEIKVPKNTFTMAGLLSGVKFNPEIWVDIIDVRTHQIVGNWHDGRLAPPLSRQAVPAILERSGRRLVIMTMFALLVITPIIVFWFTRFRNNQNPQKLV